MSVTIQKLMTQMPHTIGQDIQVLKARKMMSTYSCHHLPVLDAGKLVGVISDRDIYMVSQVPHGDELLVSELMTDEPYIVEQDLPVTQAIGKMLEQDINSLIVRASQDNTWGIFTSTDALKFFSKQ